MDEAFGNFQFSSSTPKRTRFTLKNRMEPQGTNAGESCNSMGMGQNGGATSSSDPYGSISSGKRPTSSNSYNARDVKCRKTSGPTTSHRSPRNTPLDRPPGKDTLTATGQSQGKDDRRKRKATPADPPPPHSAPEEVTNFVDMAYKGNFRGAIWNAQGLCTRCPHKHRKRWKKVLQMLDKNDFIMISETHATKGKAEAQQKILERLGIRSFWSEGTKHRAGVCILLNQKFMDQFQSGKPQWGEIQKGEAAVLQLQGANGNLDLYTLYLPTGNAACSAEEKTSLLAMRNNIRKKMAERIKAPHQALSILGGDFNYVTQEFDRWTLAKGDWSSTDNSSDQKDFLEKMGPQTGMHELHQEHATHRSGLAQSRLDRIYINQHESEQLDTSLGCATLEWDFELSHHRPVIFFRKSRKKGTDDDLKPLPCGPIKETRWPDRVRDSLTQKILEDGGGNCPLRRLQILKDSIQEVTRQMEKEAHLNAAVMPATETDDQLGWTIRFIRAAENNRRHTMDRCCRAYPEIHKLIQGASDDLRQHGGLLKVKQHAVELYRLQMLEELRDIQADEGLVGEDIQRNRKARAQFKLQKLKPGSCNSIAVLLCQDGTLATTPKDIAKELHRHWHQVFQARPMDDGLLKQWLAEEFGTEKIFREGDGNNFDLQRDEMQKTIKNAPATMPGPDGIPYLAWKRLGILGTDCLFNAAVALGEEGAGNKLQAADLNSGRDRHEFNIGNMVFLPKKVAGCDPELGDFYTANDTRPLVLVNTDNRIIAGALRYKLEPILAKRISHMQHGFLSGRSMLGNSVDIQHAAQLTAMKHSKGGLLLLDFKAAFPSLGHRYLHTVLGALGLPDHILNSINMLYHQHGCNILFGGQSFEGFPIDAGIRQGCPLSPLLLALVIDLLLRRLQKHLPNCTIRAFADDIAIVMNDVVQDMPIIRKIFHEFSQISNLDLNLPKCVMIPLWEGDVEKKKEFIHGNVTDCGNMEVANKGTYLGFSIGPDGHEDNWNKAIRKYLDRARDWARVGLGLTHTAAAYSIYILPTLTFLAQLCDPTEEVYEAERKAITILLPGPNLWIEKEDAFYLKENFGQHRSFPSIRHTAMAAQRRVLQYENRENGGLQILSKARELRQTIGSSEHQERHALWHHWFNTSPVITLERNKLALDHKGLSTDVLLTQAGRPVDIEERTPEKMRSVRKKFQCSTRSMISAQFQPDPEARLRHKLKSFFYSRQPKDYRHPVSWGPQGHQSHSPSQSFSSGATHHLQRVDLGKTFPEVLKMQTRM